MTNKWYRENHFINEKDLPYPIEITSGGSIYYRKNDALRKADNFKFFHGHISIFIEGVEIVLKKYDRKKDKFIYDVYDRSQKTILK
jgi:hypothetical protein